MRSRTKPYKKNITEELAEAISSLNIAEISRLLSEDGKFPMQNENYEVTFSDKERFIEWLSSCYQKSLPVWRFRKRLKFNIVKSMHCPAGNPVLIFENGRFPLFSGNQARNEKSGFVVISDNNQITEIELCFLIVKTECPVIYEKKCLKPDL